jgi:peptidyl-prolyl cis-trans isomerase SurA
MKHIWLFILLVTFSITVQAQDKDAGSNPILLDRVVAIVNDKVITLHELNEEVLIATRQLVHQDTPLPPRSVLERQVLERMIMSRILQQEASQTGIRISDAQLNSAIERMAADNKLTLDQFQAAMQNEGIAFESFREKIRAEMQIARLKEREVDNKVTVSESEIDGYLRDEKNKPAADKDIEYLVSHILVMVPEGASPDDIAEKRQVAEDTLSKLNTGADFAQMAAAVSDGANALEGGSLGWRRPSKLPELFLDAVSNMRVGQVSDILRSPNGFHIIKLVDERGNTTKVIVKQTHARHILIRLNEIVSESDALQRLTELKRRIELGGESFADLARQYSDDASAAKGGDLGWLSPGDTVPEFERAMDALKPGEISDPVRTPFGYHLINVIARRDEDLSEERQRLMARQAIRARKADAAYQDWIRQQRDKAYVEYRLDEN